MVVVRWTCATDGRLSFSTALVAPVKDTGPAPGERVRTPGRPGATIPTVLPGQVR